MTTDSRNYDRQGRPGLRRQNTHDLDSAQHFLADHAAELIVAFDHHATDPEVFIYVETPTVRFLPSTTFSGPCFTGRRSVSRPNWMK